MLGRDRAGVVSARTRIDVLVTSARRHLPFTHFLSLPIVSNAVQEKFDVFKEEVLQECAGVSQKLAPLQKCSSDLMHLCLSCMIAVLLLLSCAKSHVLSATRRQPHLLHVSAVDRCQIWSMDKS